MSQSVSPVNASSTLAAHLRTGSVSSQDTPPRPSPNRRASQIIKKSGRTLTAAQLEKKRANDREAQRAIRERTKHLIENLEKRIEELESGEAHQQLQAALREKQAIETENVELRNRLHSICDILRPIFPSELLPKDLAPNDSNRRLSLNGHRESSSNTSGHSSILARTPATSIQPAYSHHTNTNAPSNSSTPWEHARSDPWDRGAPNGPVPRSYENAASERPYNSYPMPEPGTVRNDPPASTQRPSSHHTSNQNSFVPVNGSPATDRPLAPRYFTTPQNLPPTCHFDKIIYDFNIAGKRHLANGYTLNSICGGDRPVLNCLTDLQPPKILEQHYLSGLFVELLKGFSLITGLPEKIAVVETAFPFMRWLVSPTVETFKALPSYMHPVDEQLSITHPIWIDFLPWPGMRRKMVYDYTWLPLERFFQPYCKSLQIDYPGRDVDSCMIRDPHTDEMYVRPELSACIRQLDNWSVGREFSQMYPAIAHTCRIKGD